MCNLRSFKMKNPKIDHENLSLHTPLINLFNLKRECFSERKFGLGEVWKGLGFNPFT